MNKIITILLLYLLFSFPEQTVAQNIQPQTKTSVPSYKKQAISYKLIDANNHTYGYNIFVNDSLFIHQPSIPCISGNKGFKSKAEAKKIAVLVIQKIRNKIIPPSVSVTEMKKLGISF